MEKKTRNYRNSQLKHCLLKWVLTPASKFMPLLGMKVHYRDEGISSDSVPLVLLHGMSSSLHTWDSVTLQMTAKKRVISLDLPGFGLTGYYFVTFLKMY